jgi:hypothetical protein
MLPPLIEKKRLGHYCKGLNFELALFFDPPFSAASANTEEYRFGGGTHPRRLDMSTALDLLKLVKYDYAQRQSYITVEA